MRPSAPNRRLDDRIQELCRLLAADDGKLDLDSTVAELRKLLAEHALKVSNKTAATVFAWPDSPNNRRRRA